MASIKDMLKKGLVEVEGSEDYSAKLDASGIKELVNKAFTTRSMLHFAHWNTKSFAAHQAVGSMYDDIIDKIDGIVETFQGKYGIIQGFKASEARPTKDIIAHIESEAKWVEENKESICCETDSIENLVDDLVALYYSTIYKLKNLK